jgi:hypothetical protein
MQSDVKSTDGRQGLPRVVDIGDYFVGLKISHSDRRI